MKKKTAREVFDTIENICMEAKYTEEELDEILREEGIDPSLLVSEVMKVVNKYRSKGKGNDNGSLQG